MKPKIARGRADTAEQDEVVGYLVREAASIGGTMNKFILRHF